MNGIETFLDSIRLSPPGGRWSFMWNKRHPYSFVGGIGFEFFIDFEKKNRASLIIFKNNSDLLSGLSIQKVSDLLSKFFEFSIEDLAIADLFLMTRNRDQSVLDIVSTASLQGIEEKFRAFLEITTKQAQFLRFVALQQLRTPVYRKGIEAIIKEQLNAQTSGGDVQCILGSIYPTN